VDLSVVIPAHNEAENIGPLVREIRAALGAGGDWEIVVVDDGSSDGTGARAADAACEVPHLTVARHPIPMGQSFAVVTGVRAAVAPWVATLDGDGQNDPADIPRLLAARDREAALGDRRGPLLLAGYRASRRDSWLKRVSSRVANGVRGRLLGDRSPDTGCGLKLFEREAFLALPHFDHMHRFLPALFLRAGGRVVSVEVRHRPRTRGRSHYGLFNRLWVGIVDMFGVMWLMRRGRTGGRGRRRET
jgi:glycosyltransferase involved in cell wall biosynthesis